MRQFDLFLDGQASDLAKDGVHPNAAYIVLRRCPACDCFSDNQIKIAIHRALHVLRYHSAATF